MVCCLRVYYQCPYFVVSSNQLHSYHIFFFNDTATTEIYTLSLHDALPILPMSCTRPQRYACSHTSVGRPIRRSEEHTSELQSLRHLVCRLLLEKKKNKKLNNIINNTYKTTTNIKTPQSIMYNKYYNRIKHT